jgi:hypothetical protein
MTLRPDIDINGINEALITKADLDFGNATISNEFKQTLAEAGIRYVKETWQSGMNWYRIWNDGKIEQGGLMSSGTTASVTLHKPFSNTNYFVLTTEFENGSTDTDGVDFVTMIRTKTTTGFTCSTANGRTNQWYAFGY